MTDAGNQLADGQTMPRVAVWQSPAGADPLAGLDAAMAGAAAAGARILVGAELMAQGYDLEHRMDRAEPADGPLAGAIAATAVRHGVALITGFAERRDGRVHNAALVISETGRILAIHRKRALPPGYERRCFTAGDRATLVELAGIKVGILVCYEVEFPEAARELALAGAALIAVPTALGDRWGVVADRVVPARAFENTLFVAYANHAGTDSLGRYLGHSCIVGPDGADLARAGTEAELITADLDLSQMAPLRERLPFLKDCRAFR